MEEFGVDPALAAQMGFAGFGNTNKRRRYDKPVVNTTPAWAPQTTAYSPVHALPHPPQPHPLATYPAVDSAINTPSQQLPGYWQPPPPQHRQRPGYSPSHTGAPLAQYAGQHPPGNAFYQSSSPTGNGHFYREHQASPVSGNPRAHKGPPQHAYHQPPQPKHGPLPSPVEAPNPHNLPKPPSWPPTGLPSHLPRRPSSPNAYTANFPKGHGQARAGSTSKQSRSHGHPQQNQRGEQQSAKLPSWDSFPSGPHDCDTAELAALRKGIRDRDGDVAYFMPSFLEDPWNLKPKKEVASLKNEEEKEEVQQPEPKVEEAIAFAVASAVEDPWNRTE